MNRIFFLLLLNLCGAFIHAQDVPRSVGFVNDFANVLSGKEASLLEQKIIRFNKETTAEIAVVTVHSTQPYTIEEYTLKLANEWGVGNKEKNNGVVILAAINDRRMRIGTGTGIEQILTSEQCSTIIAKQLRPHFRNAKYYKGFDEAIDEVIKVLGNIQSPVLADSTQKLEAIPNNVNVEYNGREVYSSPAESGKDHMLPILLLAAGGILVVMLVKVFSGMPMNSGNSNGLTGNNTDELPVNAAITTGNAQNDMAVATLGNAFSDSNSSSSDNNSSSTDTGSSFDGGSSSGGGSSSDW